MKKKFNELRSKMDPKRMARRTSVREMMGEMLIAELRKHAGMTQTELAESLGIKQPTLSRLESSTDMQVSTLQRLIEGLGGNLELIAHLPSGDVRITQFTPRAH
ncbi:helix-turn-helix transcriptional regulator [Phycisphaerales bacterium ac7]